MSFNVTSTRYLYTYHATNQSKTPPKGFLSVVLYILYTMVIIHRNTENGNAGHIRPRPWSGDGEGCYCTYMQRDAPATPRRPTGHRAHGPLPTAHSPQPTAPHRPTWHKAHGPLPTAHTGLHRQGASRPITPCLQPTTISTELLVVVVVVVAV